MVKYQNHFDNPSAWQEKVVSARGELPLLNTAIKIYTEKDSALLDKGLRIADILLNMELDNETIIAAIVYPALQTEKITLEEITDNFGEIIRKLLKDVLKMQSLGKLKHLKKRDHQVENLRKMLIAMVTDVRAVLIILAERLWILRNAKNQPKDEQEKLAQESIEVYAPLANRLGVWQLKWEMEDLCLRYLKPEVYNQIAKWLSAKRQEREEYVKRVILILSDLLHQSNINNFNVTGRVKHIYSIYKKMLRKNAPLEEIYDITALRVLVSEVTDCYTVLALLQNTWSQVQEEFDDYISQPKPNGYRSIHVVIKGPENRYNEVQIRTHQMHQESELGVAAHWRYKEGVLQPSSYETKIVLLRQIMAWQKEVITENKTEQPSHDLLSDRVYVFTPMGEIIDLPKGATPLDFAYYIHSELGHRCRGAKVNGKIVPLTHQLITGEGIEILTAKQAHPSRDWLNPQLGYIKTPRARAKAQHWFRLHDSMQTHAVDREKVKTFHPAVISHPVELVHKDSSAQNVSIQILGVNNLLIKLSKCCKPLPGDEVIGYITQSKGVSIHRRDCNNISHMSLGREPRLTEVSWSETVLKKYPVDLQIRTYDRAGILRDITTLLANEKINVLGVQTTQTGKNISEATIYMTLEIQDMEQLKKAIGNLKKIPNIIEVTRR